MLPQIPDLNYRLQRRYRLTRFPLLSIADEAIPVIIVDDARDAPLGQLERRCAGNVPVNASAAGNVPIVAFIPQGGIGTTYYIDRIICWTTDGAAGQLAIFTRDTMTGLAVGNATRFFMDFKVDGVPSANLQQRNDFPVASLIESEFIRQIRRPVNQLVDMWNVDLGDPPIVLYSAETGANVDSLFVVNRTTNVDLHVEFSWRETIGA